MKRPEYHKGDCRFCYMLSYQKCLERDSGMHKEGFYQEYKAALTVITKKHGEQRGTEWGRSTHKRRPLNFCPECGREIRRRRKPKGQ